MQVVLIAVVSLDGRITRPNEAGPGFASREDHAWFVSALREFDCSVMGRATFESASGIPEDAATGGARRLRVVMTRAPGQHDGAARPEAVEFTGAAPLEIVGELRARGFARCALLGGGQIYRAFLDFGLVDAMWITLEPVVLGGGTPLADGPVRDARFDLAETRRLSARTLLLNYARCGGPGVPLPAAQTPA